MNYLAIDTSTSICSVSFFYDSKLQSLIEMDVKEHSKFLAPMCKKLLKNKAQKLDFIGLAIGPGSYSRFRIPFMPLIVVLISCGFQNLSNKLKIF